MDYAHPEVLVETDWVAENGSSEGVRLVEVNYDPEPAYRKGHIRGATLLEWKDLIKGAGAVDSAFGHSWTPGMSSYEDGPLQDILDDKEFEKLMSEHGIEPDTKVVLYGDHANWFAAYAFWLFKIYCHKDVCLMNGGRKKWELEGREYVDEEPQVQPTKYRVTSTDEESIRVSLDDVYDSLRKRSLRLVDVRSPSEYSGETTVSKALKLEEIKRKGHIPGAVNIPTSEAINADGTFKSYDELQEVYGSRGVVPDSDVVTYCRLGERSSLTWVVLKYLLGYSSVSNYDGSWNEWGTAHGVPIKMSTPAALEAKAAKAKAKEGADKKEKKGWGGRFWSKG